MTVKEEIKTAELELEKLVKMVVAAGRTLFHSGKNKGPGTEVHLPADEAQRLKDLGFVAEAPATSSAAAPAAPALSVTATDGPTVGAAPAPKASTVTEPKGSASAKSGK